MSTPQQVLNCRYRYDPLDRLTSHTLSDTPERHRFYCKSRLATEVQGAIGHSIVQHDDLLLAQQQRKNGELDTTLLATDLQRSVLNTLQGDQQPQPIAYSPYGHRPAESGLTSLLGFNGERPDPVTGHYLLGNGYRAFNPVLMRFNSPDSWSPFGKGGLSSYAYCVGDPTNVSDQNGRNPLHVLIESSKTLFTSIKQKITNFTHPTNKYNFAEHLDKLENPLSPNDLTMRKAELRFGAMPGSQIETLLGGETGTVVKLWDEKTGLRNIEEHVLSAARNTTTAHEVISAGLRGELNGVLPYRANELSILISEGKFYNVPGRRHIRRLDKNSNFTMDMPRQREIYRQADVPLPAAFVSENHYFYVTVNAKKIRIEAGKY